MSRRAAARLKHAAMLSEAVNVSRVCQPNLRTPSSQKLSRTRRRRRRAPPFSLSRLRPSFHHFLWHLYEVFSPS
eukprot:6189354-Pleurochrysis_carterae.AAC.1